MNSQAKFALGKEPFIRKADSHTYNTKTIMRDFVIGLLPLIIFAWVKNGLLPYIDKNCNFWEMIYPLVFIIVGGLSTWALEFLYYFLIMRDKKAFKTVQNSFAIIPGLLLAMILPLNTPLWVLVISCFFATVVGKLLFGGFGCNIFNPALVGYLFFALAYSGVVQGMGGFFNGTEAVTIVSGATPLSNFANNPLAQGSTLTSPYGNIWNFIVGTIPGSLAETSGLLCIISCVWLIVRKVINWRIPVFYVGGVFVITYLIGAVNGNPGDFVYPLFQVFSGGLLFGAVFMATEPVTSPKTPNGKIVYALALASLTVFLRYNGNMPEGVATSIMFMNLFTIVIDRICAKLRSGANIKKMLINYGVIAVILLALNIYTIAAVTDVQFVKAEQDYETLSDDEMFKYHFTINNKEVVVTVDDEYNITSISDSKYDTSDYHEMFNEYLSSNEYQPERTIQNYITGLKTENNNYYVEVLVKGYRNTNFKLTFVFDSSYKLTRVDVDEEYVQSYDSEHNNRWQESNGKPEDVLPGRIVDAQSSDITVIAGATQTSNGFINGAKIAFEYINLVKTNQISFGNVGQ